MLFNNTDSLLDCCKYCLSSEQYEDLVSPCRCSGTNKFVHKKCLIEWFKNKNSEMIRIGNLNQYDFKCEICNTFYNFKFEEKNTNYLSEIFFYLITTTIILNVFYISFGNLTYYYGIDIFNIQNKWGSIFLNGFIITHIIIGIFYLFKIVIFSNVYGESISFCIFTNDCSDYTTSNCLVCFVSITLLAIFIIYCDIIRKIIKKNKNKQKIIIDIFPFK